MKRILFATLVLASTQLQAQKLKDDKVPAIVKTTFAKNYSQAATPKWELEHGNYEVSFVQDGKKMSLLIDATGKLLETEVAIKEGEFPKEALAYMAGHYKKAKISETARITKAGGEVIYEAGLKGKDVLFDKAGNFIKEAKD
ncbi:PepSY-like domain-containing protein [Parasediminibacterium sp. JCM 36343]|uniref:PepSY-like domain-containing protein n=1 Tax=Parasediminibacterium sp. JCM 36343 TaxID=3374279 RepID=UPI00397B6618